MLVDMHEKLSQAVKLYDRLLTEQLSRPQWRPTGPSAVPLQQSPSGYSQYQQVNGAYNQWQPTPSTPAPAQSYLPSTPSAPVSQPLSAYSPITEHPPQQMYKPATVSTGPAFSPSSPVTQPRYGQEGLPYSVMSPPPLPPVSIPQYGPPNSATYQAVPPPPVPVATPAPPPPGPAPSRPQAVPQAPFAPQQQPQGPTLARHNTVSGYRAAPPAAQRPAATTTHLNGLTRSNTLAASSHAPAQLQHLQQMSVPLPSFPQVPTAPLQAQTYYPPEPERKEALLIDL